MKVIDNRKSSNMDEFMLISDMRGGGVYEGSISKESTHRDPWLKTDEGFIVQISNGCVYGPNIMNATINKLFRCVEIEDISLVIG